MRLIAVAFFMESLDTILLLFRRNMFAGIRWCAVYFPLDGLGQCNMVAIEKSSRRFFILDQCFGIGGSGSDDMAFGYSQILLFGDNFFRRGQRLSEFLLLHPDNLVRELDKFERGVERVPGLCDRAYRLVDIPNGLVLRILHPYLTRRCRLYPRGHRV
jgi:hypothetical protein